MPDDGVVIRGADGRPLVTMDSGGGTTSKKGIKLGPLEVGRVRIKDSAITEETKAVVGAALKVGATEYGIEVDGDGYPRVTYGLSNEIGSVRAKLGPRDTVLQIEYKAPLKGAPVSKYGDVVAYVEIKVDNVVLVKTAIYSGIEMATQIDGLLNEALTEVPREFPTTFEDWDRGLGQTFQGYGLTDECFLSSTSISLSDGRSVPISEVREGDEVLAFDPSAENGRGGLVPRRVTAVHRSEVDHVLDVFGLGVTPGHATLCGDGPHEGRFRPVMDILIEDGAVVNEDGSLRRLSTNAPVGSNDDLPVQVALVRPFAGRDAKGRERRSLKAVELGWLRTGTRFIKPGRAKDREAAGDGTTAAIGDEFTLGEVIRANGWQLVTKGRLRGMIRQRPGDSPKPFPWGGDALPRPEDYVLAKSGVTLNELRQAAKGPGAGIEPWVGAPTASYASNPAGREPLRASGGTQTAEERTAFRSLVDTTDE